MAGKSKKGTTQPPPPQDSTKTTVESITTVATEDTGADPAETTKSTTTRTTGNQSLRRRNLLGKAILALVVAIAVGLLVADWQRRAEEYALHEEFRISTSEERRIAKSVVFELEWAARSMAKAAGTEFPNASDWPQNAWIEEFQDRANNFLDNNKPDPEKALFLAPLMIPTWIGDLESSEVVTNETTREFLAPVSQYSNGRLSEYSQLAGVATNETTREFLAPVSQYSHPRLSEYALMDLHGSSNNQTTGTIDRVVKCLQYLGDSPMKQVPPLTTTTIITTHKGKQLSLTTNTDEEACRRYTLGSMVSNPWKGNLFDGSVAIMVPVYPDGEEEDYPLAWSNPGQPVAFVVGAVSWWRIAEEMNRFGGLEDDDLDAVFRRKSFDARTGQSREEEVATYALDYDVPYRLSTAYRIGTGDQHDPSLGKHEITVPWLYGGFGRDDSGRPLLATVDYGPGSVWEEVSLSLYPTKDFFEKRRTSRPLYYGLFAAAGVLVVASVLLVLGERRRGKTTRKSDADDTPITETKSDGDETPITATETA